MPRSISLLLAVLCLVALPTAGPAQEPGKGEAGTGEVGDRQLTACAAGIDCAGLALSPAEAREMLNFASEAEALSAHQTIYGEAGDEMVFTEDDVAGPGDRELTACAAGIGCDGLAVSPDEAREMLNFASEAEALSAHQTIYGESGEEMEFGEEEVAAEALAACAAGIDCSGLAVSPAEARELLDHASQEDARAAYEAAYGPDASPAENPAGNPAENPGADTVEGGTGSLAGDETGAPPEGGTLPGGGVAFTEEEAMAGGPWTQALFDRVRAQPGHREQPCRETGLYTAPDFMGMAGWGVAICTGGENGAPADCGQAAANAFCLTQGHLRASCFGLGMAPQALNVGIQCLGGCPVFDFIVC